MLPMAANSSSQFLSALTSNVQQFRERNGITAMNVVLTLFFALIISKTVAYRRGVQTVRDLPGFRILFHPLNLPGVILPTSWWNPGYLFPWYWRDSAYKRYGNDTISVVPFLAGPTGFYTSNLDVARQVITGAHKCSFFKHENSTQAFLLWGMNLVAADGDTWRKHRRIMGPAFNNALYDMVWSETLRTYKEMISAEGWDSKDEIEIPVIQKLTFQLALLIIGKCGFGFSFNWFAPPKSDDGRMSIQEALRIVADTHMAAIFTPKWVQNLPIKGMQEMREAHDILTAFMQSQVAERKAELSSGGVPGSDAFTMLVKANEDEGSKYKLDDQELIGNVFVMLFAGHETTAHTLAATLGFLAMYDNLQDEVYQQIVEVVGLQRDPTMEDYPKLDKVLAAFYEALRMFPAGHIMIRDAFEDTVLHIPKPVGEEGTISVPIQKGMQVVVDMIGVQYNPRYFDQPEEYRPSRWYGLANESEAFSAFSIGPRACIGRKFATVESVCFLALILRDYKVEPLLNSGETRQQWRDRVLDGKVVLTLGVKDVPVRVTRRK
ncbi:cytochrome P450 [Agrocybe pediades]|nr:cytochrome P450 [Agrocybe pediades]